MTSEPPSSSSSESSEPFDVTEAVRAFLTENGIRAEDAIVEGLAKMVLSFGEIRGAKLIGRFFSQLPDGPGTEAVFRFMFGSDESLRDAARRHNCAPSTLLRAERNFARLVGLKIFTQHPFAKLKKNSGTNDEKNEL